MNPETREIYREEKDKLIDSMGNEIKIDTSDLLRINDKKDQLQAWNSFVRAEKKKIKAIGNKKLKNRLKRQRKKIK